MSEIKSSYELAMERLKQIPADSKGLKAHELRDRGKRLFASLRKDADFDLQAQLPEGDDLAYVREGLVEVLLANIVFPGTEAQISELSLIRKGFSALVKNRNALVQVFAQLEEFLQYYLQAYRDIETSLKRHFIELLRQKTAAIEKKYGQALSIDPSMSPEYLEQLRKSREQLQRQNERVMEDLKRELCRLAGVTRE